MTQLTSNTTTRIARTRRNTLNVACWTGAWLITMALATFGPQFVWGAQTALTISAIVLNAAIGIGMIIANMRHLNGLDELQRRIALEAMALTLGVGLVAGFSYSLLADTQVISYSPQISHLLTGMALTFIVGLIVNERRYQ